MSSEDIDKHGNDELNTLCEFYGKIQTKPRLSNAGEMEEKVPDPFINIGDTKAE